jgi:hypothetical protein
MPIRVAVANQWIDTSVLVDSGSDTTILDAELAEDLGLTLEEGEHAIIRSATGHDQDIYFHQVQLAIGPISYGARVAFMRRADPYGLAGQLGLFDQFHISFDRRAEEFELRPYNHDEVASGRIR